MQLALEHVEDPQEQHGRVAEDGHQQDGELQEPAGLRESLGPTIRT